jgi:hypothetical protein
MPLKPILKFSRDFKKNTGRNGRIYAVTLHSREGLVNLSHNSALHMADVLQ